jgi:hypothetical protein
VVRGRCGRLMHVCLMHVSMGVCFARSAPELGHKHRDTHTHTRDSLVCLTLPVCPAVPASPGESLLPGADCTRDMDCLSTICRSGKCCSTEGIQDQCTECRGISSGNVSSNLNGSCLACAGGFHLAGKTCAPGALCKSEEGRGKYGEGEGNRTGTAQ